MLSSRGLNLLRVVATRMSRMPKIVAVQNIRKSHVWSYRVGAPAHSKATIIGAEAMGAFMWWWILWHLYHEYEHVIGEFDYPDPSKWTDAELGIPPDNE